MEISTKKPYGEWIKLKMRVGLLTDIGVREILLNILVDDFACMRNNALSYSTIEHFWYESLAKPSTYYTVYDILHIDNTANYI